ncbi:aldehyde dehydrogenase B [Jejuia pallidilutea]|uniref:Aldehyde dehydrogenase B n=1 Tax=Jejuia pallidilutea TaxID=504487 RepID=A0A090VLH4_9FLAO|nr:aldehyde dehydrogenase B [Jejuia pallidilutea]
MSKIATDFGIDSALKILGINNINDGTSTGSDRFSNGEIIESYSPVNGALIGKVKATTKEDYNKVMQAATSAFAIWRSMPAPQREILYASLEINCAKRKKL